MSHFINDRWNEDYLESLGQICDEKNAEKGSLKYQPKYLLEFLEQHENQTPMDLADYPTDAAKATIQRYEDWEMEEKTPLEDRI